MEPIISPWIIYAIWLIHGLRSFVVVVSAFLFLCYVGWVTFGFGAMEMYDENERKKFKTKQWKRIIISGIALFLICAVIVVVLPPTEVIISMIVATYVTPDNVAKTSEVAKDIYQEVKSLFKKETSKKE